MQAFRNGLSEAGYVEGRNVRIAYRWTGGQAERLPALAAELAALKVSVIVTLGNTQAVRAAKAATPSIPIVFMLGTDPVELGFVASLARPGGNLTGVFNLNQQLAQKWLEVLHEIVPAATSFALLVNPTNPATTMRYTEAMQAAAQTLGLRIHVVQASADREFDAAFANVREHRAGALAIAADALFISRVDQLAALGLHHAVPALYPFREFAAAGGLASYGTDLADTYRSAGLYTGRIQRRDVYEAPRRLRHCRLERDGPNVMPSPRPPSPLVQLGLQMVHFFALVLWVAAGLAFVAGMPQLTIAIIVVVVLNGVFAFAQEYRAERAGARLADLLPPRARVVRDGAVVEVPGTELVVDDVVLLEAGDRVSADLRPRPGGLGGGRRVHADRGERHVAARRRARAARRDLRRGGGRTTALSSRPEGAPGWPRSRP